MEPSILTSTKKILGLEKSYTAFDLDIITHINATFSVLSQMGIGPVGGFMIEDSSALWEDYDVPQNWITLIRTYMFLRVRYTFDPPGTSFQLEAMSKQIAEYEARLSMYREGELWTAPT